MTLMHRLRACTLAIFGALILFGVAADAQQVSTYAYDATGRLVRVTHPNNSVTTYTYDAAGNRVSVGTVTNGVGTPTANGDTVNAYPINIPGFLVANAWAYFDATFNDTDPAGSPLTVASASNGTYGTTFLGGAFIGYASNTTTNGTDSFTYTATNGHKTSAAATVNVNRRPQDASPYPYNDFVEAYQTNAPPFVVGAFTYFDPRENDRDFDNYPLTITAVSGVTSGVYVAVDTCQCAIAYIAPLGATGNDSFNYTISNGHGGTRSASVTVHRNP